MTYASKLKIEVPTELFRAVRAVQTTTVIQIVFTAQVPQIVANMVTATQQVIAYVTALTMVVPIAVRVVQITTITLLVLFVTQQHAMNMELATRLHNASAPKDTLESFAKSAMALGLTLTVLLVLKLNVTDLDTAIATLENAFAMLHTVERFVINATPIISITPTVLIVRKLQRVTHTVPAMRPLERANATARTTPSTAPTLLLSVIRAVLTITITQLALIATQR